MELMPTFVEVTGGKLVEGSEGREYFWSPILNRVKWNYCCSPPWFEFRILTISELYNGQEQKLKPRKFFIWETSRISFPKPKIMYSRCFLVLWYMILVNKCQQILQWSNTIHKYSFQWKMTFNLVPSKHAMNIVWKVSKIQSFCLVRIFLYSGWIRRFILQILVFSRKTGNYRPEKTPYLDTFHAVESNIKNQENYIAWKVFVFRVILVRIFP